MLKGYIIRLFKQVSSQREKQQPLAVTGKIKPFNIDTPKSKNNSLEVTISHRQEYCLHSFDIYFEQSHEQKGICFLI